jgi:chromate transporter
MPGNMSLAALFRESLRLGATTFGAARTPHSLAAFKRRLSGRPGFAPQGESEDGLGFLNIVPGGTPAQMCGWLGLGQRGLPGAAAAFLGYCLPGFVLALALAWLQAAFQGGLSGDFVGSQGMGAGLPMPDAALFAARAASCVPGLARFLAGATAGLQAAVPAFCLLAGLGTFRGLRRSGLLLGLFLGATVLFVIGLKPFSMLLGGGILGVLLLPDPDTSPAQLSAIGQAPPATASYDWRLPVGLLLLYALCMGGFFLADARLGKLFFSVGKAETYGLGGPGAFPILFADAVGARHWLAAPAFAALTALSLLTPGPALAVSALLGWQVAGPAGALAALAGVSLPSFFILLAAAPASRAIGSCPWAFKARDGFLAVLGGMTVGLGARLVLPPAAWDAPHGWLAACALVLLAVRLHPAWVALLAAAAGGLLGL